MPLPISSRLEEQLWPSTPLQRNVLKFVCENANVDYDSLEKHLNSERTTIVSSAHTLAGKSLVRLENVSPKNPKSRVLLAPTDKGIFYAVYKLDANYYKYVEIYEKQYLKSFNEMFPDSTFQQLLFHYVAQYYVDYGLFDKTGRGVGLSKKEEEEMGLEILLKLIKDGKIEATTVIRTFKSYFGKEAVLKLKLALIEVDKQIEHFIRAMNEEGV